MQRIEERIGRQWRDGVYLTTTFNSMESEIVESKLRSEDIPSIKKYIGASNFLEIFMGDNSTQEIDIYVPSQLLDDAIYAIEPVPIDETFEGFNMDEEDELRGDEDDEIDHQPDEDEQE